MFYICMNYFRGFINMPRYILCCTCMNHFTTVTTAYIESGVGAFKKHLKIKYQWMHACRMHLVAISDAVCMCIYIYTYIYTYILTCGICHLFLVLAIKEQSDKKTAKHSVILKFLQSTGKTYSPQKLSYVYFLSGMWGLSFLIDWLMGVYAVRAHMQIYLHTYDT